MATTKRTHTTNKAARTCRTAHPRALALAVATAFMPWVAPSTGYAQTSAPAPNTVPTLQLTSGSGKVHEAQGSFLQIDQYGNRAIFSGSIQLGANAHMDVRQPNARAAALFEDTSGVTSQIWGRVSANGQVFFSNTVAGILIGRTATINAAAVVATTLAFDKAAFLDETNNALSLINNGNTGSVINQGRIITANGYTALIGPQVRNDGVIEARAGKVVLAAGERVSLDLIGDGLISVSVDQAAYNASVIHTGTIEADGGTVLLTARSANALLDTVINSSGVIRANSLVERNGEIVLDGGSTGVVSVTGTLQAAGVERGTTGGTIKVLGDKIGLFGDAVVDASGDVGGGTVLIGGNFQGKGPQANALRTYVGSSARISADAISEGDGGTIIVWADDATRFYGTVSSRGGSNSGNGGFAEISGKGSLDFQGNVDLSAPNGAGGTVLFDPLNITISAAPDANTTGFTPPLDPLEAFADDSGQTSNFNVTATTGSFTGVTSGSTIELQAQNNITLETNFNVDTATGSTDVNLTLRAGNNVDLGAGFTITTTGGNVSITANDSGGGTASGTGSIIGDANIVTSGGTSANAGNVTLSASGTGTISVGNITALGGDGGALSAGGSGGIVSATTLDGNITAGTVQTSGGNAGAATAGTALAGGNGGNVTLQVTGATAPRAISVGGITARGGAGSNATVVNGPGGGGGTGGVVSVTANAGASGASLSATSINTTGGAGGSGLGANSSGNGGSGGGTTIQVAQAATITGTITTSGGTGGNSSGATGTAGNGGNAGAVSVISSGSTVSVAGITTTGGAAGNANGGTAGAAGAAAAATISAATNITLTASINAGANTVSFNIGQAGGGGILTIPSASNITAGAISVTGAAGTDTIAVSRDADMTLTDSSLAVTSAYTLGLTDIEGANLTGGASANTFTVSGWTGTGTLAGGGADVVAATKDANFTLSDAALSSSDGMSLTLSAIGQADLTGGASGNSFTVSGWTGSGTMDGAGGTGDAIVATNDVNFTLTNTSLARSGGQATLTLAGMEAANLTGGVGANTFTVSGWTGTGALDGGASGTDVVTASKNAGFTLSDAALSSTDGMSLTLTGIDTANLTGGAAANTFGVSSWTGTANLAGAAGVDSYTITFNGAGGTVNVTDSAGAADSITVNGTAGVDAFTLTDAAVSRGTETVNYTSAQIETLAVNGLASDDSFTVSALTRGATLDGGAGTGDAIVATNDVNFTLTNTSLARSGGQATLTLANMEAANLTGGASANTFTVSGWTGTGTLAGGGGADVVAATKDANFTLSDAALSSSDGMSLTLSAIGQANLTGGASGNSFTVSGWTGSGTMDGAGGTGDAIVATNDVNFTLANASLARSGGQATLTLAGMEAANLTGGASANTFTVSGWAGSGTMDGAGGTGDAIVATNDVNFTLANTSLARSGGQATLTLAGIEAANLTGGASANTFTVSGWTGTGALTGGGGDVVAATKDANFTLSDTALSSSDGMSLTLSAVGQADLTGGASDNSFTVSGWTGSGSIAGAGGIDTLTRDGTNAWSISAANTGTLNTTISFSAIETLTGGTGADTFTLAAGVSSFAGTINGGTGSDTLTATNGTNAWVATGANAGTLNGTTPFTGIATLTGGTGTDTLQGTAGADSFSITGAKAVTVSGMSMILVEALDGGAGNDTFTLAAGVPTFNGSIAGGGGNDTVAATNGTNSWAVSGVDAGALNTTTTFTAIANLSGGSGNDSFAFQNAGSISGSLAGGAQATADTLDLSAKVGAVSINTTAGTATGITGTFGGIESVVGNGGTTGTTTTVTGTTFSLTGANTGTADGIAYSGVGNLAGVAGGAHSFTGAGGDVDGTITDGGGTTTLSGTITSTGAQTYTGAVTLAAATTLDSNAASVSLTNTVNGAQTLQVDAATAATLTGGVGGAAALASLTVNAPNITLGSVTTNGGAQQYNGNAVTSGTYSTNGGFFNITGTTILAGDTTINASSGNATFGSTIDGAFSLQVNDGGTNTFSGAIGNTTALANIGTDSPGTSFVGGNVTVTGSINFLDVTTTASPPAIVMTSTGGGNITINNANATSPARIGTTGAVTMGGTTIGSAGTPLVFLVTPNSLTLTQIATAFFSGPAIPGSVIFPPGSSITYNGALIAASFFQQQAFSAASQASSSILTAITEEANKTFGTDSVAEDVEYGFAGEIGATPPMDHRIDESGISLPQCVQESREGLPCK